MAKGERGQRLEFDPSKCRCASEIRSLKAKLKQVQRDKRVWKETAQTHLETIADRQAEVVKLRAELERMREFSVERLREIRSVGAAALVYVMQPLDAMSDKPAWPTPSMNLDTE